MKREEQDFLEVQWLGRFSLFAAKDSDWIPEWGELRTKILPAWAPKKREREKGQRSKSGHSRASGSSKETDWTIAPGGGG